MKLKRLLMSLVLAFMFLTANAVDPGIFQIITKSTSVSIAYASPKSGSSGFKSGGFKSSTPKSSGTSGFKSGSFKSTKPSTGSKSGSYSSGGFSSWGKNSGTSGKYSSGSSGNYSSGRTYIPIPIPMGHSRSIFGTGSSFIGGSFIGYIFGKLFRLLIIILIIYIALRLIRNRR